MEDSSFCIQYHAFWQRDRHIDKYLLQKFPPGKKMVGSKKRGSEASKSEEADNNPVYLKEDSGSVTKL